MGADKYFSCVQSIRIDLLELFGSGYVIEHCVSTLNMQHKEDLFRSYIAKGVELAVSSLTNAFGGQAFSISYDELIKPVKEETRTEEEIVSNIQEKLKGQ